MQINFYSAEFKADGSCLMQVGANQHFTTLVERSPHGLYKCQSNACQWNHRQLTCEHVSLAITVFENELKAIAPSKIMEAQQAKALADAKAANAKAMAHGPGWVTPNVSAVVTTNEWRAPITGPIRVWESNRRYVPGDKVIDCNGNIQECVVGGKSKTSPLWPLVPGMTVTQSTPGGGIELVFRCVGPLDPNWPADDPYRRWITFTTPTYKQPEPEPEPILEKEEPVLLQTDYRRRIKV